MVEISAGTGKLLYYPEEVPIKPGDVFYLRERDQGENGVIVQVIRKETASYSQADSKVIWRLLTKVRAQELQRTHHEPTEVIDRLLAAIFKVRASIVNGQWQPSAGNVVTRNVDIFQINPALLLGNILRGRPQVNVDLGEFNGEPVAFSGQGFDKVNLVTGMKGAGKSHITKGIVLESRKRGMPAVVFDINNEYGGLDGAVEFTPGRNLKFRLDRMEARSFLEAIDELAPFTDRTGNPAKAGLSLLFNQRKARPAPGGRRRSGGGDGGSATLDISFLKQQADKVLPGSESYIKLQRSSFVQSLEILERYNLFATAQEAQAEDEGIRKGEATETVSLTSAFHNVDRQGQTPVIVFSIGGLLPSVQTVVVKLVIDHLKGICDRQSDRLKADPTHVPIYPTVYFEEAHMYMNERDINNLIPVIRHLGMNLFFITNTPGALPDSVFRLLDNLIMTRMVSETDIRRVEVCGLADKETIEGFAPELPEYHALILSAKDGVTKNFPLVFKVSKFDFKPTGVTRSMWQELDQKGNSGGQSTPPTSPAGASPTESAGEDTRPSSPDQSGEQVEE
jgi:hypothetical protein